MKTNLQIKKLGDICEFQNGFAFKSSEYVDSGFFVMRIGNVQDGYISLSDPKYIKKSYKSFEKFILQSGDILISLTGNVGRVGVINSNHLPSVINQRVARVVLKSDNFVQKQFLLYFLKSAYFKEELINVGHGAAQQNISTRDIENLEIPLPSFQEQKRIVKVLDEVFNKVEKSKENTEKNLQNSKVLFESYLQGVLTDKRWKKKLLGDICIRVEYGSSTKSKERGKIAVLRMGNIQNGKLDWTKLVYSDDIKDNKQYLLKYNDVLFNRTNSPELVGKTAIYKGEIPAIFAGYLIRIHRKEDLLDADYLNYYLNSKIALDYGKTVFISSVNQANINGTKLKKYPIPVPLLKDQKAIVKKLDELSNQTKKLEVIYKKKLADLEELKKSVLKKAFDGEL